MKNIFKKYTENRLHILDPYEYQPQKFVKVYDESRGILGQEWFFWYRRLLRAVVKDMASGVISMNLLEYSFQQSLSFKRSYSKVEETSLECSMMRGSPTRLAGVGPTFAIYPSERLMDYWSKNMPKYQKIHYPVKSLFFIDIRTGSPSKKLGQGSVFTDDAPTNFNPKKTENYCDPLTSGREHLTFKDFKQWNLKNAPLMPFLENSGMDEEEKYVFPYLSIDCLMAEQELEKLHASILSARRDGADVEIELRVNLDKKHNSSFEDLWANFDGEVSFSISRLDVKLRFKSDRTISR